MADAPKKLSIPIETPANLTGLKETAKELKNVEDAAKKGGKSNEESGKKAEFLGLKFGELKKLTRELGREFPIAGYAARLFLNPVAAAFTIAIAIFAKAKEAIDDMNKSLDEAGEKAADPTFKEGIEARKAALEAGALKAEEFNRRMERGVDVETEYIEAVRNAVEATHALEEADQKLADAQQGMDTEVLKRKLQDGLISQAQYYQQLIAIEKAYEAEKLAREKQAHADEIGQLQNARDNIVMNIRPDREAGVKAVEDAALKRAKLDQDKKDLENLEKQIPDKQKAFDEADKKLQAEGGAATAEAKANDQVHYPGQYYPKLLQKYKDAESDRQQLLASIQKIKDSLPGQASDTAVAESDANLKVGIAEKDKADASAFDRELKQKRAQYGSKEKSDAATSAAGIANKEAASPIGASPYTGADIAIAAGLEHQLAIGQKLSAQNKQWLDAFMSYFGIVQNGNDAIMRHLYKIAGTQSAATTKLESLDTVYNTLLERMRKLESRSGTPPPR